MTKKNRKTGQRGATILEFGLSFLVFFALVYGIIEFGRIVSSYNILAGATREAARYAMVHGSASGSQASASDLQTIVRNWAVGLNSSSVVVTTVPAAGPGAPGTTVQVQASYAVAPITSFILQNSITLKSSSQMVISQ